MTLPLAEGEMLPVGTKFYDMYNIEHEVRTVVDGVAYAVRYNSPKNPGHIIYEIVYGWEFEMDPSKWTLEPRSNPVKWG